MNIFLLGNGFDLHYSLPTSYSCFLHTLSFLLAHPNEEKYTIGAVFKQLLADAKYYDKYIEKSVNKYGAVYDEIELPKDKLLQCIEIVKTNKWFHYLNQQADDSKGWVDFEREIKQVLSVVDIVFHCAVPFQAYNSMAVSSVAPLDIQRELCRIASAFNLGTYYEAGSFRKVNELDSVKGERFIIPTQGILTGNLYVSRQNLIQIQPTATAISLYKLDKDQIATFLLNELRQFSLALSQYLQIFVDFPMSSLRDKGLLDKDDIFSSSENVITLNYTFTYEQLYDPKFCKGVQHIHGTTVSPIVLGIPADENDEEDSIDISFLEFKKYYQRFVYQTDKGYWPFISFLRRAKNQLVDVYVFGHSLDETDKDIIRELFSVATGITVFYYSEEERQKYGKRLIAIFGKAGFDDLHLSKNLVFIPSEKLNETIVD